MIALLVRSVDFERVLRTRSCFSSAHFALHHLPGAPAVPSRRGRVAELGQLSTADVPRPDRPVDDPIEEPIGHVWWGAVVPKRHARRAVTRTLLKRQIRVMVNDHATRMPSGLWVVRLRAPFDRARFVSASSEALKHAVRDELERLLVGADAPNRPTAGPPR